VNDVTDAGEDVAHILKQFGVTHLFTLCGGHISPILVGAKKEGIRVIDTRQEATAVFAADAMARLTGIPGVAAVTAGPGATNAVTAIKNAQMAGSPLILLSGAAVTLLRGRGALQDIDQHAIYRSIVKWATRVEAACDYVAVLEEAREVALSGVPGPVFIECPVDTLYDEAAVRKLYEDELDHVSSKTVAGRVTKWYVRRHVDRMFTCAEPGASPSGAKPGFRAGVAHEDLARVLRAIDTSAKPVMIVGSQAMIDPALAAEIAMAVTSIDIPVYLESMARGLLGRASPVQFRHDRSKALREADLVILAGAPIDFRLDYGRAIRRSATVVSIRREPERTERNRKPDIRVQADPASFLIALAEDAHRKEYHWQEWLDARREAEQARAHEIDAFGEQAGEHLNPVLLCKAIDAAMADDSLVIGDGGDFIGIASYVVRPRGPYGWLDPGPYGTLGVGAGFAMAAKLLKPSAEVWLLYGDGAAGYGLMEFDTFVRHGVPVIAVIGNDAGWTQIWRDQVELFQDDVGTLLLHSDYHVVAEGLGARGLKVDAGDDLPGVLAEAKAIAQSGHPVLVNAIMDRTTFRKGSISM
jgi:acetolactate synthase-1/2/3 large subunit